MKKHVLFLTLLAAFSLVSCVGNEESSSSLSSSSNSSSVSSSSTSDFTSYPSAEDLPSSIVIDDFSSLTEENLLTIDALILEIGKGHVNSDNSLTLDHGGYVVSRTGYSAFTGLKVTFTHNEELTFLSAKGSDYPIYSYQVGSDTLQNDTEYTLDDALYFTLSCSVGSVNITKLEITTEKMEKEAAPLTSLDFYTINDTHGAITNDHGKQIGISAMSSFYKSQYDKNPEGTVILSSGDMWQGTADSNITRGETMTNWMNLVGFEAMAIGNHEFDWGVKVIEQNKELANFPYLGINILDPNNQRPAWASPSMITYRGPYKIGIVGGIGNLESSIAVSSLGGYSLSNKFRNLIEDEAERLKTEEACDIIVVSIHNGNLSLTSKGAKYINAVFEGHTHENYAYNDEYGIPHVQCYSNGSDIQQVSFRVNSDGELVLKQPSLQDHNYYGLMGYPSNEDADVLIDYYATVVDPIKNEVLGYTDEPLNSSYLATLSMKATLEYYQEGDWHPEVVAAFANTGSARTSLPAGEITYGNVYQVFPFDNANVFCTVSGMQVNQLLADSYYASWSDDTVNIEANKTYTIVAVSYVTEANPDLFKEIDRDSEMVQRDIFADYLRNGGSLSLNG